MAIKICPKPLAGANWIGISVISELEFLSFPSISNTDILLFELFQNRVDVIGLDSNNHFLIVEIIRIRKNFNLKLPDSILAATAIEKGATLLTNDLAFKKITGLLVAGF